MIAMNESRYGALLTAMARFDEAEPLLTRSYEVLRKTFGERHQETVQAAARVAALYAAWGKPDRAAIYLKAASPSTANSR